MRMLCPRLLILTNAFSKKRENFEATVSLHFANQSLVKSHKTTKYMPAMKADDAETFCYVRDLVERDEEASSWIMNSVTFQEIPMNITVGGFDVLESGVVSSFDDKSIVFTLDHNGEQLTLTINFAEKIQLDSKGQLTDSTDFRLLEDASMTLRGWDSPQGVAYPKPVVMGTIGGRTLHLLLRCYGMFGQKNRMVSYTFLLGGVENAS